MVDVDWSKFDAFPESACECRCGSFYRSHAKVTDRGLGMVLVSRKPCPGCGSQEGHLRAVRSDPEVYEIRRG